jgi:hypothetical protein
VSYWTETSLFVTLACVKPNKEGVYSGFLEQQTKTKL